MTDLVRTAARGPIRIALEQALARLPAPDGKRFASVLDEVLALVVLVERAERQLHLGAHPEGGHVGPGHELAEHDHALVGQLDGRDGVGLERIGRDVGRRRLVAVVRE